MLQHNKKNDKFQANTFVDGVLVKISEKYKPPRRIILPVSCQNCCPGESLFNEYDFKLEESIIKKLSEWKNARRQQVERRKEKIRTEMKVCDEIEQFSNVSISQSQSQNKGMEHINQTLNYKLTDSILTPTCAKQNSPSHKQVSSKFNFSDFESDNSSPFDNMELKTINDMEVLASILSTNNMDQPFYNNNNNNNNHNNNNYNVDKSLGKNCLNLNHKNSDWSYEPLNSYHDISYSNLDCNSYSFVPSQHKDLNKYAYFPINENIQISNYGVNDFSNQFKAAATLDRSSALNKKQEPSTRETPSNCETQLLRSREENSKSIPDIMIELQHEIKENREREEEAERKSKLTFLKQTILSSNVKGKNELPESSRKIETEKGLSKLPDPTCSLDASSLKLVRHISDMGFPLPRVARAWEMFDGDDEKILEFLLQVQSLEEKNYPGDLIEKALLINNFKLKETLRYLEAMVVLLDLGFEEVRAEEALLATNIDRDKALDMLIS